MRVVLGDVADAREPVQRPRELVAMQRRSLGEPERELAVAPQPVPVYAHVTGTVHRLQRVDPLPVGNLEHVLAELLPVAGGLPEPFVVDKRRSQIEVAASEALAKGYIFGEF